MASVSGPLHGRLSVGSIQNHDRVLGRLSIHHVLCSRKSARTGQGRQRRALPRSQSSRPATDTIVSSWAQGLLHGESEAIGQVDSLVHIIVEVLQAYLVPVVLCNVVAAWWSLWVSGLASLQLPVQYVIKNASTYLECMFLVPLIPAEGGGQGAAHIARLAALQLFHEWMHKSWDRVLCWYHHLCTLEAEHNITSAEAPDGKIHRKLRKTLQADREKLCLNSEALSVDLSVAMPVAEAVLGEAEVLATIVACEELPHHINAPRRLPDNSEEHAYVSSRIHRHEILLNRRKQLQPLTATQTHSVNMLQQSIKSRLIFATVRRALQMDALGCKPLGLDVVAFKAVAASSSTSGKDTSMMCYVAPPKRVLLPLVDELLSSYDSYRLALWPVEDPVVKYLSQGVAQDEAWSGYAADPWRRAATARNAVRRFMHAIQATTTDTLLGHLRPHMMSHWTMRISSSKERKQQERKQAATSATTEESQNHNAPSNPTQSPTPSNTSTPAQHMQPPREDTLEVDSLEDSVRGLAQHMPLLARTEVPCSEAVFASSRRDPRLQCPPSQDGSQRTLAEHLEVLAPDSVEYQTADMHLEAQNSTHSSSETIRQIWGLRVAQAPTSTRDGKTKKLQAKVDDDVAAPSETMQGIKALATMPARRASKDFMSLKSIADQLVHQELFLVHKLHSSPARHTPQTKRNSTTEGYSAPARSIVHKAVWDRVLALPDAAPARVWQSILTPPAPLFAQALAAQDKWEVARIFRRLSQAQQSLEQFPVAQYPQGLHSSEVSDSVVVQSESVSSDAAQQSEPSVEVLPQPPRTPGSDKSVWRELLLSTTDADGQRVVRSVWAATVGLTKLAKGTSEKHSSQNAWQKKSSAMLDLQAAVQDLTRQSSSSSKKQLENAKWGDHEAHRSALYKYRARLSEIKGLAAAFEGPLGPMATPQWLASAAASKGSTSGPIDTAAVRPVTTYTLPSLNGNLAGVPSQSQTPEWLHARMAHAWAQLGVAGVMSSGEEANSRGSSTASAVWTALFYSHSAMQQPDAAAQNVLDSDSSGPGPLRYFEFEEEVLFTWDLLVSADARVSRQLHEPIDGMGGAVWQVLLDEAALRTHAVQRAWGLHVHTAHEHAPRPADLYCYQAAPIHRGVPRRRSEVLEVWTALQHGLQLAGGRGALEGGAGAVGGNRFSAVRDSMDQLARSAMESMDQTPSQVPGGSNGSWRSNGVYGAHSSASERRSWQQHSNRLSAAAARKLRARAEVLRDIWDDLDQEWVQKEGAQVVQKPRTPQSVSVLNDSIGVFSFLPEDLDACIKQVNRTHKIYFDKARKSDMKAKSGSNNSATSKLVRRAAQMPEQTLEFGSMPSDGRSPHDQLRMFAELLLMQSQPYYRAGMSSDAWFPADRFVVQFQQHKSGDFIFRRPTGGDPTEYPTLQVSSVHPVVACVGAMLTSLSPGLTMTNKPGALKHGSPSPVARLGRLLSRVAVLGAVPATIAVATLNREPQIEAAPDTAPNRMLGEAATYSNMEPMESASSTSADSSALESRSSDSGSDALAAPLSSTVAHRASVSMGQQVAMAKQVMEELKGCVWHGLEVSKRGDAVTPAVFHVLMSPEGCVLDIMPHSTPARKLLPRLPIMDSIVSRKSGEKLRRWRARYFDPTSKKFEPTATVPFTPRRKNYTIPRDAVVLELVVYNDATGPRSYKSNLLETLVTPIITPIGLLGRVINNTVSTAADVLAGKDSKKVVRSPKQDAPVAASTVLAAPVDMEAFSLVADSFQMAMQEYEPYSILDGWGEGEQERCMACVQHLVRMLRTHRESQGIRDVCKSVLASLEAQLQEYDELCTLRSHDEDAPVSKDQALLETCRAFTSRYHTVLQEAVDFHDTTAARHRIRSREPAEVEKVVSST